MLRGRWGFHHNTAADCVMVGGATALHRRSTAQIVPRILVAGKRRHARRAPSLAAQPAGSATCRRCPSDESALPRVPSRCHELPQHSNLPSCIGHANRLGPFVRFDGRRRPARQSLDPACLSRSMPHASPISHSRFFLSCIFFIAQPVT